MTPLALQDLLVEELKTLFDGEQLNNENGVKSAFSVYPQYLLPIDPTVANQASLTHFPHIRVILSDGEDPDAENSNKCNVLLEIGIHDATTNYQGHRDLMNIINKIYRHFMAKKFLGPFEIEYPFHWSLNFDPELVYPKFYGIIETSWIIPKVIFTDTLS
jgi:hypothetical protein